jgi:hypothetical protein
MLVVIRDTYQISTTPAFLFHVTWAYCFVTIASPIRNSHLYSLFLFFLLLLARLLLLDTQCVPVAPYIFNEISIIYYKKKKKKKKKTNEIHDLK